MSTTTPTPTHSPAEIVWPFGTAYAVVRSAGEPIFFGPDERDRAERVADIHRALEGEVTLHSRH